MTFVHKDARNNFIVIGNNDSNKACEHGVQKACQNRDYLKFLFRRGTRRLNGEGIEGRLLRKENFVIKQALKSLSQ